MRVAPIAVREMAAAAGLSEDEVRRIREVRALIDEHNAVSSLGLQVWQKHTQKGDPQRPLYFEKEGRISSLLRKDNDPYRDLVSGQIAALMQPGILEDSLASTGAIFYNDKRLYVAEGRVYVDKDRVYVAVRAEGDAHKRLPIFLCRVYRRDELPDDNANFTRAHCVVPPASVQSLQYLAARALARSGTEELARVKLRSSVKLMVDILAVSEEAHTPAGEVVVDVFALATALLLYQSLYGRPAQTSGRLPVVAADMA